MGFWDQIRGLFKSSPTREGLRQVPPTKVRPASDAVVVKPGDSLPDPGDTAVDLLQLLFSNKDKHTTSMLNSISLSSDMKTLYLVDNGRAIPFDLTVPEGVIIGLLGGQLVVATAATPFDPLPTTPGTEETPVLGARKLAGSAEKFTFKAGENSQYTVSYNEKNKALGVIGVDDLIFQLQNQDNSGCSEQFFSLEREKFVRIVKKTDVLEIVFNA
jgi:hypothetical protein